MLKDIKTTRITLNDFDYIIAGIGEAFSDLRELSLWSDSIKSAERHDFAELRKLTILELHFDEINFLSSDVFYDLANLEVLRIDPGKIEKLHKQIFMNSFNLKKLVVWSNEIEVLEKDLFANNPLLEEINFTRNQLKVIHVDFTMLKNLKSVELRGNKCISEELTEYYNPAYGSTVRTVEELQSKVRELCG